MKQVISLLGDDVIYDLQTHLMEFGSCLLQLSNFYRSETITNVLSPIRNRFTVKGKPCGLHTIWPIRTGRTWFTFHAYAPPKREAELPNPPRSTCTISLATLPMTLVRSGWLVGRDSSGFGSPSATMNAGGS